MSGKRMIQIGMFVCVILLCNGCRQTNQEQELKGNSEAVLQTDEPQIGDSGTEISGEEREEKKPGSVPSLENGFQRMRVHKKSEESTDTCWVHLDDEEDNAKAWKKIEACSQFKRKKKVVYAEDVYLPIMLERMNGEYLEWMKKRDPEHYKNITEAGYFDASVTVIGSDDFKKMQMIYGICSESDKFAYIGKYSLYNYRPGETFPFEKRGALPEFGTRYMWEIDQVGYECPWYLDYKTGTDGILIGMNMELFQKYFDEQYANKGSYYVVQAEKGKRDELMQIIYKYFPEVFITSGTVHY